MIGFSRVRWVFVQSAFFFLLFFLKLIVHIIYDTRIHVWTVRLAHIYGAHILYSGEFNCVNIRERRRYNKHCYFFFPPVSIKLNQSGSFVFKLYRRWLCTVPAIVFSCWTFYIIHFQFLHIASWGKFA